MEHAEENVNDLKIKIKELNDKITELQSNCKHTNTTLKYFEDSKQVLKICSDCEKVIGYPTQEELREYDYL